MVIGCTVGELRRRMGSAEFTDWQVFFEHEGIGPQAEQQQWASLMSALYNGPLQHKGKRHWLPADFMPRAWQPADAPARPKPATGADARAFVARQRQARAEAIAARKAAR